VARSALTASTSDGDGGRSATSRIRFFGGAAS
jgi:hypothetical protein